jgi:hypothetical protein
VPHEAANHPFQQFPIDHLTLEHQSRRLEVGIVVQSLAEYRQRVGAQDVTHNAWLEALTAVLAERPDTGLGKKLLSSTSYSVSRREPTSASSAQLISPTTRTPSYPSRRARSSALRQKSIMLCGSKRPSRKYVSRDVKTTCAVIQLTLRANSVGAQPVHVWAVGDIHALFTLLDTRAKERHYGAQLMLRGLI